ncbi:proton-conducting transporter transmembrane domain-containing protein [Sporolactobacillus sp. KGMB 08714]|uniref:proton-conducting transporter transmembrane domain-containing protein n=1 Tax=Sporolactobacillus sp. KGMB 08714 TaxID=3064704 RepID=UPI002FBE089F
MTLLFWIVTLCFLLTGIFWTVWIKNRGLVFGWFLVALLCLLDTVIGVKCLLSGNDERLGEWGQIIPFGHWFWRLDGLGAFFITLMGVIGFLVAIYNVAYVKKRRVGYRTWALASVGLQYFFTNILIVSSNALPMLIAWEGMSLMAFCYVLTDHLNSKTRRSALLTIVTSEIGFLALVIALLLPSHAHLSMTFNDIAANLQTCSPGIRLTVAILAFIGFGVKAGIIPVQFWLPRAYLVVPGNLGALLAGSLVNLGIFGILRVYFSWFGGHIPDGMGAAMLLVGSIGVFLGALYATILRNLRHILGYSSIENTSFMLLDLGLVILYTNHGDTDFAAVSFTALLILMLSHGLAKALAFLDVEEIENTAGTTNLDQLKGLIRRIPATVNWTFLVACLSLATVAPFSGFTAEWMGLQGLFQIHNVVSPVEKVMASISLILLALGSALALTAFLRAYVYTFGSAEPHTRRKAGPRMPLLTRTALTLFACLSALLGFLPTLFLNFLAPMENGYFHGAIQSIMPNVFQHVAPGDLLPKLGGRLLHQLPVPGTTLEPASGDIASIAPTYLLCGFILFGLIAWALIKAAGRPYKTRRVRTWQGGQTGYSRPGKYSATAYSNIYRMLFSDLLSFKFIRQEQNGHLPVPQSIHVWTRARQVLSISPYEKIFYAIRKKVRFVSYIQHGYLFGYIVYVLTYLLILLLVVKFMF